MNTISIVLVFLCVTGVTLAGQSQYWRDDTRMKLALLFTLIGMCAVFIR